MRRTYKRISDAHSEDTREAGDTLSFQPESACTTGE